MILIDLETDDVNLQIQSGSKQSTAPDTLKGIFDEDITGLKLNSNSIQDHFPLGSHQETNDDIEMSKISSSKIYDGKITSIFTTSHIDKGELSPARTDNLLHKPDPTPTPKSHRIKLCPDYLAFLAKTSPTQIPKYWLSPAKFLPKNSFETIGLVSYPRSGNTLLRKYLEETTKICTGSDSNLKRKLVRDLRDKGMYGEGITDSRVWVVKSHYPERREPKIFKANKIILLVRNPLDAIVSLFNMNATSSHNYSISRQDFEDHYELFEEFYDREIK